ncbi:hypothetical protein DNHGIG_39700 [Collibacillus ludicampi]|uniref:Uncharacterized protein n=1 Tax=Collibacillus ludicampi TaxID=2771369 RepID=A0AAV4LKZ7_9BACL|nr:hypothetical protein DNHGIG_39700 [Collibacillus ludicampi]
MNGEEEQTSYYCRTKNPENTAEIISDDIAKATARHFLLSSKLLDVFERALSAPNEFYRVVGL